MLSALSTARSSHDILGRGLFRLVTQHEDLDILGRIGAGEQHQPAQHAGEHQIRESEGHSALALDDEIEVGQPRKC